MGIDAHSEHSEFKMQFRIEQQPDGTFLGISDQPHLEIKGATREEVLQKIKDSMGSRILEKLGLEATAALDGPGIHVTVNKKFTITQRNADGSPAGATPVIASPAEISGTTPITSAPIDAPSRGAELLKSVIGLLVLIALAWWFFHR